jgi:predicted nucleic acid-binding protein
MKTVVSNSSPICYLVLIGEIHLLAAMFKEISVPEAVIRELRDEGAPEPLREWAARPPKWLKVQRVAAQTSLGLERLHAGERDVILLARQIEADLLIMDEKAARQAAIERGLNVTGLIGILDEAAALGMLDLLAAVEKLRLTSFRASPHLLKTILDRHHAF